MRLKLSLQSAICRAIQGLALTGKKMPSLVDRRATLRAAFAGDDPDRVSTLQAGGAATTRYLSKSDRDAED